MTDLSPPLKLSIINIKCIFMFKFMFPHPKSPNRSSEKSVKP